MKKGFLKFFAAAGISLALAVSFAGCGTLGVSWEEVSAEEWMQTEQLLGDLNSEASASTRERIGCLLHRTNEIELEREAKGNYKSYKEEEMIWKKITDILDKETIRQFGEFEEGYYDEEISGEDYGRELLKNLSKVVSSEDLEALENLREVYFAEGGDIAAEYADEEYPDKRMKEILVKYQELDADAVFLGLVDDRGSRTLALYRIGDDGETVYIEPERSGLSDISEKEKKDAYTYWKKTTEVLPKELFKNISLFKVGGDGEGNTMAYVMPMDEKGIKWVMSVDPDDIADDGIFPYTAVHEMFHYISLNDEQAEYLEDYSEVYPDEIFQDGILYAEEGSYIQDFYTAFWKSVHKDWETNPENIYFYIRHQSEFVTEYASTNCAEDMAETFCAYVLMKEAPTEKTKAKFNFFDQYPELRKLKTDILANIEKNNVYVNPEIQPEDEESQQ